MLTDQETDQLVAEIQQVFPALGVSRRIYPSSGEYVVIAHDPRNQNEVRITSLRSNWRRKIAAMHDAGTPS